MTIAACYVSPEGVVFGADSAATFGSRNHYFHGQKIFEVGKEGKSTLGLTTWGLGSMGLKSYRTLIAMFSDDVVAHPGRPLKDSVEAWSQFFWDAFTVELKPIIDRITDLKANPSPTSDELQELEGLISSYSGGFCIGGYSLPDRTPRAFTITYNPSENQPGPVQEVTIGSPEFWGQPNMLTRLSLGIDIQTFQDILDAKKSDGTPTWGGTIQELVEIVVKNKLGQPSRHLPVREAIDWVYSSIYTTIKAMKFANLPPVCGGPIEIAVVTTDRCFRWVRHKAFDAAIGHHPAREH